MIVQLNNCNETLRLEGLIQIVCYLCIEVNAVYVYGLYDYLPHRRQMLPMIISFNTPWIFHMIVLLSFCTGNFIKKLF